MEISGGQVGNVKDFPYIIASSWVKLMSEQGFLHNLFGQGMECNTLELAEPHPAQLSVQLRRPTGEGGLQFWHKQSFLGATTMTAIESRATS